MPVIFLLLFRCLALYRLLYYVHRKDSEVSRAYTWIVPLTVCWILTVKCSSELLFVPFFWRRHVLHMIELMHFPGGCTAVQVNWWLSESIPHAELNLPGPLRAQITCCSCPFAIIFSYLHPVSSWVVSGVTSRTISQESKVDFFYDHLIWYEYKPNSFSLCHF